MALLLNPDEIAARMALYKELSDAISELGGLSSQIPSEHPATLIVSWDDGARAAEDAVLAVCAARWPSLREAALTGAKARVRAAEERVKKFEAGEEVE